MRFNNILAFLAAIFLGGVLTLSSCTKDFVDMNKDPNRPSDAQAEWLLTAAQKRLADLTWDEWNNGRGGMYYAQYFSATAYTEESRYQIREGINNGFWSGMYAGVLADLVESQRLSQNETQAAIAELMKVYAFHVLTDMYGNIPFSQAIKGMATPSPAYDEQSVIYPELIRMIDAAVAKMKTTDASFGAGDIMYRGNIDKWKKFANSLKLRIALRMSDVSPAAAKTAAEAALAAGVITANADNALFTYLSGAPNNNPQEQNWVAAGRQDFSPSKTLVDYMLEVNDPRLPFYAAPAEVSGTYIGKVYGLDNATATAITNDQVSMPSVGVIATPTAPAIFISAAEMHFAMAEAVERGWTVTGTAAAHYEMGIRASMAFWGVSADVDAYVAANPYTAGTWKNVIGTQKWLSMYMQGLQAWSERLRLDFRRPDNAALFVFPANGSLDPNITAAQMVPMRMTYPTDEYGQNAANTKAAAAKMGGDTKAVKLWWDVN